MTAALGAVAVTIVVNAAPDDQVDRGLREALVIFVPAAVGFYALQTPGARRFGALLIGVGQVWSLTALAELSDSLAYSIGRVAAWPVFPILIYLMLIYPQGRIRSRLDRAVYAAVTLLITALYIGSALFVEAYPTQTPWADCDTDCPRNAFMVLDAEPAVMHQVVQPLREGLAIVLVLLVAQSLVRRMRRATPLTRRQILPVLLAGVLSVLTLAAYLATRGLAPGSTAVETLASLWVLLIPTIAAALYVGLVRRRLVVAEVLQRLSLSLGAGGPRALRAALARALGDPELDILVPDDEPGRWRDTSGRLRSRAEEERQGHRVTTLGDPAGPGAAVLNDPELAEDDELRAAVGAFVLAAVRQQRLERRLTTSLRRLIESRKRLAHTAAVERSRIERDLHDGAQQRLIMLRIKLSLAEELLASDPAAGAAALHELGGEVDETLDEVRALAHGVYPQLLSDRGLANALYSVVSVSPLRVHLETRGLTRQPAEIEAAVYFTCLEALQNAMKHADGATAVWLSLHQENGQLSLEARDDGSGFMPPRPDHNGGLRNMRDRLEAVDGRLVIDTAPGRGTRVMGTVPVV